MTEIFKLKLQNFNNFLVGKQPFYFVTAKFFLLIVCVLSGLKATSAEA